MTGQLFLVTPSVAPPEGEGSSLNLMAHDVFSPQTPLDPSVYYTSGSGEPAISTADYYGSDGIFWMRCYDLLTFGAVGIALAASRGRYYWLFSADHPQRNFGWTDASNFQAGFSDDPETLPYDTFVVMRYNATTTSTSYNGSLWAFYHAPWLVYNPDDVATPFYLYCEGQTFSGAIARQHNMMLSTSSDLLTFTQQTPPSHETTTFGGWASYQRVFRNGTGDWVSYGRGNLTDYHGLHKWTSTDGRTFTIGAQLNDKISAAGVAQPDVGPQNPGDVLCSIPAACDLVTVAGQLYMLTREDHRPNGVGTGVAGEGVYVSLVPFSTTTGFLAAPAPIHISDELVGLFPGPSFLQDVSGYLEDGIAHIYSTRGFFASSSLVGTVNGADYADGGGLNESFVDIYRYIYDASLAADAAPVGIRTSCNLGTVTLTWNDALPNNTYRVYRGTTSDTQATLIGDVTGVTTTDSPGTGTFYYKIVTMKAGVEKSYRVVRVYASSAKALTNKHIDRVTQAGGDVTKIDTTWMGTVVDWLETNNLTGKLIWWADPKFGVTLSGAVITTIFDLGCTILPRNGDYTPTTSNTTYSATGVNGTPGEVAGTSTSPGHWGTRRNQIRRKRQITVAAAYTHSGSALAALIAMQEFQGVQLLHTAASPGAAARTRSSRSAAPCSAMCVTGTAGRTCHRCTASASPPRASSRPPAPGGAWTQAHGVQPAGTGSASPPAGAATSPTGA